MCPAICRSRYLLALMNSSDRRPNQLIALGGAWPLPAASQALGAPLGQRSAKCHRAMAGDRWPGIHWRPINGAGVGHESAPDISEHAGRRTLESRHMEASVHPGRSAPSADRPEGSVGG